jgi:hypothetical protein
MSKYRSIIITHTNMINLIPENQIKLITDLINFIKKIQTRSENYLSSKSIYRTYLHIILQHLPRRPLKNSDPEWMWKCQEVFSSSEI